MLLSRFAAPSLLTALLVGCATSAPDRPPVKPPIPPPAFERGGLAGTTVAPDPRWWRALSDPVLDALVERALMANRDLLAAEADLKQARAVARLQGWTLLPTGGAGASYAYQRPGRPPRGDLFSVGGEVAWEADVFGRLRAGGRAAEADAVSVDEARRGVMVALAAETSVAYAALRGAQARLTVARANVDTQAATLRLTEGVRDAGRGTRLEVAQAREQLGTTRALVPGLEAEVAAAIDTLEVLGAGLSPELRARLEAPSALPAPPETYGLGAPEDLLRRRPDIRQAEARLAAAAARVDAARVDWWPRLTFLGSVGWAGGGLGSLFDSDGSSFSIGPRIDWPALDYRRNALRLEAARAGAEAEFLRFDGTVIAGVRAVETALANLQGATGQARELAAATAAAREAAELSRIRYRQGLDPFLSVLDAERRLAEAEDRWALARTRQTLAFVRLGQALGAGWEQAT
jgi:multidrug efflux system outer membrane protein